MIEFNHNKIINLTSATLDEKLKSIPEFFYSTVPELTKICNQLNASGNWISSMIDFLGENYLTSIVIYQVCFFYAVLPRKEIDNMFYNNLKREWILHFGKYRWFKRKAIIDRIKIEKIFKKIKRISSRLCV